MALLLGASACAPDELWLYLPDVTWEGENLYYAPDAGVYPLCEGTLPYMDRYVALVSEAMGGQARGPLLFVHGREDHERCIEQEAFGCARWNHVSALVAPQEHAIVHGVRRRSEYAQIFIEEGTAEVFGDDARLPLRMPANGDLMEGMESSGDTGYLALEWFPRAGHFVAYLHAHYGKELGGDLLSQTIATGSADGVVRVIEAFTRAPFADLRAAYEAEPICDQAHYRYPVYACDAPEALRARCDGDVALEITERIACDDPTTIGPRDGEMWKVIGVDVPEDGEYVLSARAPEGSAEASLVLKECSMRCDSIRLERSIGTDPSSESVFLRAGRYEVRLTQPEDVPGSVVLRIEGDDCR